MKIRGNENFCLCIKAIFFILLGSIVYLVVGAVVESNNAEKVLSSISARNLLPVRYCIPTCGDSWRAAMLPYRDHVDRRNELLEWSTVMVSISCCYSFVFWRFLLFRRFNYLIWLFRIISGVIMDVAIIVAVFVLYYGLYTPAALKKEGVCISSNDQFNYTVYSTDCVTGVYLDIIFDGEDSRFGILPPVRISYKTDSAGVLRVYFSKPWWGGQNVEFDPRTKKFK